MTKDNPIVNFLIVGTQKGGTSALDSYLRTHPDICMANTKEVHFFDNEKYFQKKEVDYSAYHLFFDVEKSHKMIGEATPIYMYWYDIPRRIWEYNPNMKIIVILRNPIERAYSHWNWERYREAENLPFWDAIQLEQERSREALPYQHRVYSYIDRGFYSDQLRRIWHYFPKEQTLIIKNEDLRKHTYKTMESIFTFLGVDPLPGIKEKEVNLVPYVSSMQHKERDYLQRVFKFEIRELERILGWDCCDWLA